MRNLATLAIVLALASCAGSDGEQGPPGQVGPKGEEGQQGPEGPSGDPGQPTVPGEPGERGERGEPGVPGRQGEPGPAGRQGDPGPPGPNGEPGGQGPQGEAGASAGPAAVAAALLVDPDLRSAMVEALRQDETLRLEVAAVLATDPEFVDSTTGPAGEQGPEGPTGQIGPQGPAGDSGPEGEPGAPGERGAEGPQGPRGEQGPEGPEGPAGQDAARFVVFNASGEAVGPVVSMERMGRGAGVVLVWVPQANGLLGIDFGHPLPIEARPQIATQVLYFQEANCEGQMSVGPDFAVIPGMILRTSAGFVRTTAAPPVDWSRPQTRIHHVDGECADNAGGPGEGNYAPVVLIEDLSALLAEPFTIERVQRIADEELLVDMVRGPQGAPGEQGERGPQGERGLVGPMGPEGEQGPAGLSGAPGERGTQGERGPEGPQGLPGADVPRFVVLNGNGNEVGPLVSMEPMYVPRANEYQGVAMVWMPDEEGFARVDFGAATDGRGFLPQVNLYFEQPDCMGEPRVSFEGALMPDLILSTAGGFYRTTGIATGDWSPPLSWLRGGVGDCIHVNFPMEPSYLPVEPLEAPPTLVVEPFTIELVE